MKTKRLELLHAIEERMNHAIDLFYKEISVAFAPLAAFCTAERRRYEPLMQKAEKLKEIFGDLAARLGSGE
jgi:hypothetical protein